MCGTLLTTALLLVGATTAAAQSQPRFALGPVARIERVWLDGHTKGETPVAGLAASVRVSKAIAVGALNTPAQPQSFSLSSARWGAESVPAKNRGSPLVAARRSACRSSSRFSTGRQ